MRTEEWSRVQPILEELLEHPAEEREAILDRRVGDDTGLRRRVLELIERDEEEEAELRSPFADVPGLRTPGDTIGPYRLQERIGHGGMGEVWRVEREDEHFRMQAALKLIRSGMATDEVLRRFKRERQVQAGLDHPGIARLLDGGATSDGLPYTVMELVDGQPIDDYCRARGLSVRKRLELFGQVCDAVHHAHASLVVHRDLKPSNVLVTTDGTAKLLDFGIAKLLSSDEEEVSLLTATGQRLLTPRYASPEQVLGEPVGTASDVYSLGVLLYELLTEQSPYGDDLTGSKLETAICQRDPQRPSTSVFDHRRLHRRLRGDLDNIVLMALRKEKSRRYSSAEALADDVRRHLVGLPVRARPDTIRYRTGRFVRRNRLALGATVVVFVSLLAGLIVSTGMYLRAEAKSEEASWQAYVASIAAVDASLGTGHHVREARQRLESAPAEHRGWEYEYLLNRLDRSILFTQATGRALTVELGPESRRIACASGFPSGETYFQVWDSRSGELLFEDRDRHAAFARDIVFSPDGTRVACVADDGKLVLWNIEERTTELAADLGAGPLRHVAFHPGGKNVAVSNRRGAIWITGSDATDPGEIAPGRGEGTAGLLYSSSGDRLFVAYADGAVKILDAVTGEEERGLFCGAEVVGLAVDEPADLLVISTGDLFVRRYRLSSLVELGRVPCPPGAFGSTWLSDDGALAAVPSVDRGVLTFETRFGTVLGDLRGNVGWSTSLWGVDFSRDGSLVVTSTWEYEIRLWDVEGSPVSVERRGHSGNVLEIASHPGGKRLASASADGTVGIWDARAGLLLRVLDEHEDDVSCVAFSPDGRWLVTGSKDGSSRIWDAQTWSVKRVLQGWSTAVDFSPNSDLLVLGGSEGRLGFLAAPFDGDPEWKESGSGRTQDLEFSPDGRSLASAHWGEEKPPAALVVWDVEERRQRTRFSEEDPRVISTSYSPAGDSLLYATNKGAVVVRDSSSWEVLAERTISGMKAFGDFTYSPDGRRIFVPSTFGTTGVWDSRTLTDVFLLGGQKHTVYGARFSPEGDSLAVAGKDDTVRFWTIRSARDNAVPTLVRHFTERLVLPEDIVAAIERHPWLDDGEKKEALAIVGARRLDSEELNRQARRLMRHDPTPRSYREVVDIAQALGRAQPGRSEFLVTQGMALFRLGALEDAEKGLARALESADADAESALLATAFLAMARHERGDVRAASLLEGLRAQGLGGEAEQILREARIRVLGSAD